MHVTMTGEVALAVHPAEALTNVWPACSVSLMVNCEIAAFAVF